MTREHGQADKAGENNQIEFDSKPSISPSLYKISGYVMVGISGIALLADILAIGQVAYDVIAKGQLADLGFKLILIVIVFLFGASTGVISYRGFENTSLPTLAKIFAWMYITLACLSYLGIAFVLNKQDYTLTTYVAFVLVVFAQLIGAVAIDVVIEGHNIRQFSIPILTTSLVHSTLMLYTYVIVSPPINIYLAGDILFFVAMTLVGSAMLGDIGFRTVLSRVWLKISKSDSSTKFTVRTTFWVSLVAIALSACFIFILIFGQSLILFLGPSAISENLTTVNNILSLFLIPVLIALVVSYFGIRRANQSENRISRVKKAIREGEE